MKIRGWQKVLLIIIPYFIVVGIFQVVGTIVAGGSIMSLGNLDDDQELIVKIFDFAGTSLLIYCFVKFVFKDSFVDLGFHKNRILESFLKSGILVVGIMIIMFLILVFTKEISITDSNFNFIEFLKSIVMFILVAFVEELLFRGYVQHYLMQSMNKYISLVITSVLFAAMHLMNPNVSKIGILNIFIGGILMGFAYIKTKNLWFPVAIHFWWNFTQVHLGFNVSGRNVFSILNTTYDQPDILNGGAFGFEGSILSLVSLAFIILVLNRIKVKRTN